MTAAMTLGFFMPPMARLKVSHILYLHVPVAMAMEIAFLLAAWHASRYLKTRRMEHDAQSVAFAEVGVVFGIITTITGSIWSKLNWGVYWNWDAQEIGIVAVLLTFLVLFALRDATEDEEKARSSWAAYAIFGFISAVFWTIILSRIPQMKSLHPHDILVENTPMFKIVFWSNVAGFTLLMIKAALLRGRVQVMQEKLKEYLYVD